MKKLSKQSQNEVNEWLIKNSENLTIKEINEYLEQHFGYRLHHNYPSIFRRLGIHYKKCDRKYNFKENIFEKIDTKEAAWLLGLFISDGCLRETNGTVKWFQKDLQLVETIRNVLYANNKIEEVIRENRCYYQIILSSRKMCNDLINLNFFDYKSHDVKIPVISENLEWHLIRGIHDGDGSNFITSRGALCCAFAGTFDVLNFIKRKANVTAKIIPDKRTKFSHTFRIQGKQAVDFLTKMYVDSENLRLERKFRVFNNS